MLSQFTDPDGTGHPTLRDYVPVEGVYPVGRLDHDSEGLMLLTSDGALQHRLTDPKFEHPRTYWVQVEGIPTVEAMQRLETGVEVRGYRTRRAKVRLLPDEPALAPRNPPVRFRRNIPTAWMEVTLTEGRNRQVRRMTAAVGFPTLRLVRVAIGLLRLEELMPGAWREAGTREIAGLLRFPRQR